MITSLVYRDQKQVGRDVPVDTLAALRAEPNTLLWIDLADPTDAEVTEILQKLFGFHPLAIEDCVSDSPTPKLEPYEEYLYLVMHALGGGGGEREGGEKVFEKLELDLFLGKNYMVTYHRAALPVVAAARERFLKAPAQPVRGPDRFAHTLLDLMVDAYRPVMEELHHKIDQLEEGVLGSMPADELFPRIVSLRKQLSHIRRIVQPEAEIIGDLATGKHPLIRPAMVPYLRDLAGELTRIDHQAGGWAEQLILSFRIYLNKTTHEANEGIRVLTALTALTFPAILVGSWFGMNFQNMRELRPPYAYALAAAVTVALTLATWRFIAKRRPTTLR
jgi:magnesium transporter